MRSIVFGILALLALIVISALGVPGALAQGGGKSQRDGPQAPVGHRQPTAQDAQAVQKGTSADQAVKKADDNLKKKLQGICHGC